MKGPSHCAFPNSEVQTPLPLLGFPIPQHSDFFKHEHSLKEEIGIGNLWAWVSMREKGRLEGRGHEVIWLDISDGSYWPARIIEKEMQKRRVRGTYEELFPFSNLSSLRTHVCSHSFLTSARCLRSSAWRAGSNSNNPSVWQLDILLRPALWDLG